MLAFGLHGQEPIFKSGFEALPELTIVSGSDQVALPLTSLTEPLRVSVSDSFGQPVPGHSVSFTVTSGAGLLSSVDTVTNIDGEASAEWTLGAVWGSHTVEVTAQNIPGSVMFLATTDTAGATIEQIEQAIALDPPQGSTAPAISGTASSLRELAMLTMYAIEVRDLNAYGDDLGDAYVRMMDGMISEFALPVTEGIRIWMMYNHGFVVKTPSGTFAFDLRDGPSPLGPMWAYELSAALLDQIDILFISHEHDDHWQARVALAVVAAGGYVVYPSEAGNQYALENYGNYPMTTGQTVTLGNFEVTAYFGLHSAPNRIYKVMTPGGVSVMHTGDTQDSSWIPLAGEPPLDVMLINGWMNEGDVLLSGSIGMINSIDRANPRLMIPGHYARLYGMTEQTLALRSYPAALAVPAGLAPETETDVKVLLWGERIDYLPGIPATLVVTTISLQDAVISVPYSKMLAARGGDHSYTWSLVEGSLPEGLSLAPSGEISGTPAKLETRSFIAEVTSGDGQSDLEEFSITVIDPLPVLQPHELCSDYEEAIATFEDATLESKIRAGLGIEPLDDLTCSKLFGVLVLFADNSNIESLVGIQNLPKLKTLYLDDNLITDISALSNLTKLTDLRLKKNSISNISALSGLTLLVYLYLDYNSITDISALSGLTSVKYLQLPYNSVSDISALSGLHNVDFLLLNNNSVSDISPLSGLTKMRVLFLQDNLISDISPLSGLTNLSIQLYLDNNLISDISALSGLTQVKYLQLNGNSITDISALTGPHPNLLFLRLDDNVDLSNIQPLLDNSGLGDGETLFLSNTNVSCADVALLEAKGLIVTHTCL